MPNCHDSNRIQDFILTEHNGPERPEEIIFGDSNIEKIQNSSTDHFDEILLLLEVENQKILAVKHTFCFFNKTPFSKHFFMEKMAILYKKMKV